jgi:hypothetical protein
LAARVWRPPAAPYASRDKVRARNDRANVSDHAAHANSQEKENQWMTAYLISLALVGLTVIAVWEGLS